MPCARQVDGGGAFGKQHRSPPAHTLVTEFPDGHDVDWHTPVWPCAEHDAVGVTGGEPGKQHDLPA